MSSPFRVLVETLPGGRCRAEVEDVPGAVATHADEDTATRHALAVAFVVQAEQSVSEDVLEDLGEEEPAGSHSTLPRALHIALVAWLLTWIPALAEWEVAHTLYSILWLFICFVTAVLILRRSP